MAEEVDPLLFIPREVRDKLDTIAVKLHLCEWQQLTEVQRQQLREQPCASSGDAATFSTLLRQFLGHAPEPLTPKSCV